MSNKKDIDTKVVKVTDSYDHHDLPNVNKTDLDEESFKTVHMADGIKIIIAKEKSTGITRGVRILLPKTKK